MKNSPSCVHVLHKTLNLVISRRCFCTGRQRNVPKLKTHVQSDCFCSSVSLFLWRCRCRCRRVFVRSLILEGQRSCRIQELSIREVIEGVACQLQAPKWGIGRRVCQSMEVLKLMHTSYAMLSSGIPWNIPRVTWFFFVYTRSFRRVCILRKIKSRVGYSRYTTRKHCIINLSHGTHWINFPVRGLVSRNSKLRSKLGYSSSMF